MKILMASCVAVFCLGAGSASGQPNCTIPSTLDAAPAVGIVPDTIFINTAGGNASPTDIRAAADTWNVCSAKPSVTLTNTGNPGDVEGSFETWTVKIDTYANLGVDSTAGSTNSGFTTGRRRSNSSSGFSAGWTAFAPKTPTAPSSR